MGSILDFYKANMEFLYGVEDYMYPDNTSTRAYTQGQIKNGEFHTKLNERWMLDKFPPAPTTRKITEENDYVDILDYITKIKGITLSNKQIIQILEILYETKSLQDA